MKAATPVVKSPAKSDAAPSEIFVNGVKVTPDTPCAYSDNPKRAGSAAHSRYEKYASAKTVSDYFKLNNTKHRMADLRHDLSKGFVEFNPE